MIEGQDVSIPRGNTKIITISITKAGEPYDLSLPSAHRLFYTIKNGNVVVLTKDSDVPGSGIVIAAGNTSVEVTLTPTNTDLDPLAYNHELEIWHPDGSRWDAMHGALTITSSTIHPAVVA